MSIYLKPPINTKGRYTVNSPFDTVVLPSSIYTCVAVRKYIDLETLGINVYESYYQPYEIEEDVYNTDLGNDTAVIVSLRDQFGKIVYIPNSFITAYPNMGDIPYQHTVIAVSMGPIPTTLPLNFLQQQMKALVSDVIGIEDTENTQLVVNVVSAPIIGSITPEQHEIMEAVRVARITNRQTDRARFLAQQQTIDELQERITLLENELIDSGVWP